MAVIESLLVLAVGIPAGLYAVRWGLDYMRKVERLKARWGLEWQLGRLVGEPNGYPVEVTPPSDSSLLIVEVSHKLDLRDLQVYNETIASRAGQLLMGPDLQLGDAQLDDALHIRTQDEAFARMLLSHPGVLEHLRRIVRDKWTVWLRGDTLTVSGPGTLPEAGDDYLSSTLALVECLAEARRTPWAMVADHHGLKMDSQFRKMRGQVRGFQVQIEHSGTGAESFTRVRVRLEQPLIGLQLSGSAGAPELRLGDPILDGRIYGSGPSHSLHALKDDRVRGPLLAVLLEHQGTIDAHTVSARVPGRASSQQLSTLLQDAVDLASVLSQVATAVPTPSKDAAAN